MSLLDQFEQTGKQVYEVTQGEWINIMTDHYLKCGYSLEQIKQHDEIEIKCYHEQEVRNALKNGLTVPQHVLNDYPTLITEVEKQIEQEKKRIEEMNSIPLLTESEINNLNVGDKITVDGFRFTVHEKSNNSIVARLYKKRNKGIKLTAGERYNLVVGW